MWVVVFQDSRDELPMYIWRSSCEYNFNSMCAPRALHDCWWWPMHMSKSKNTTRECRGMGLRDFVSYLLLESRSTLPRVRFSNRETPRVSWKFRVPIIYSVWAPRSSWNNSSHIAFDILRREPTPLQGHSSHRRITRQHCAQNNSLKTRVGWWKLTHGWKWVLGISCEAKADHGEFVDLWPFTQCCSKLMWPSARGYSNVVSKRSINWSTKNPQRKAFAWYHQFRVDDIKLVKGCQRYWYQDKNQQVCHCVLLYVWVGLLTAVTKAFYIEIYEIFFKRCQHHQCWEIQWKQF